MWNFKLLISQIDPAPFLDEINSVDSAWDDAKYRQSKIAVQRETLAISLRGLHKSAIGNGKRRDTHESHWTAGSRNFPRARKFLEDFALDQRSVLGRAKIVCLPAGKQVLPHIDQGEYYQVRNRYHFVIHSTTGSWMKAEDEEVRMKEGELWWLDNKRIHETRNDGDEDQIHLVIDMLPNVMVNDVFGSGYDSATESQ